MHGHGDRANGGHHDSAQGLGGQTCLRARVAADPPKGATKRPFGARPPRRRTPEVGSAGNRGGCRDIPTGRGICTDRTASLCLQLRSGRDFRVDGPSTQVSITEKEPPNVATRAHENPFRRGEQDGAAGRPERPPAEAGLGDEQAQERCHREYLSGYWYAKGKVDQAAGRMMGDLFGHALDTVEHNEVRGAAYRAGWEGGGPIEIPPVAPNPFHASRNPDPFDAKDEHGALDSSERRRGESQTVSRPGAGPGSGAAPASPDGPPIVIMLAPWALFGVAVYWEWGIGVFRNALLVGEGILAAATIAFWLLYLMPFVHPIARSMLLAAETIFYVLFPFFVDWDILTKGPHRVDHWASVLLGIGLWSPHLGVSFFLEYWRGDESIWALLFGLLLLTLLGGLFLMPSAVIWMFMVLRTWRRAA